MFNCMLPQCIFGSFLGSQCALVDFLHLHLKIRLALPLVRRLRALVYFLFSKLFPNFFVTFSFYFSLFKRKMISKFFSETLPSLWNSTSKLIQVLASAFKLILPSHTMMVPCCLTSPSQRIQIRKVRTLGKFIKVDTWLVWDKLQGQWDKVEEPPRNHKELVTRVSQAYLGENVTWCQIRGRLPCNSRSPSER